MDRAGGIRKPALLAALLFASMTIAAPVSASVACSLSGTTLTVTASAAGDTVEIGRGPGSAIWVSAPCSGGSPAVDNVDQINVSDSSGGGVTVTLHQVNRFAPGATAEPAAQAPNEIEFSISLGAGTDHLVLGAASPSAIGVGTAGVNFNAGLEISGDVDITTSGVDNLQLFGGNGSDEFLATGYGNTGSPYASPISMSGGGGDDVLYGGSGDDRLRGMDGDDQFDGGAGTDEVNFGFASNGVRADLEAGEASGEGDDLLSGVERLAGTDYRDYLRGDDGNNILRGFGGDDLLEGRGGDDGLGGGEGRDTASYSSAPSRVRVQLGLTGLNAYQDTLGEGIDFVETENVSGSIFADELRGDAGANRIAGGAGPDLLWGGAGNDRLLGGGGRDTIRGEAGRDRLYGGAGRDRLYGGAAADLLNGGRHRDLCSGGAGRDRFRRCEQRVQ